MRLLVNGEEAEASARAAVGGAAEIVPARYGDIWLRDTGPIFARATGAWRCGFATNSWGGKYDLPDDATVGDDIAASRRRRSSARIDFVLEGGAVDHDGEGTVLTTGQMPAEPQPQPGWTKAPAEARAAPRLSAPGRCSGSTRA